MANFLITGPDGKKYKVSGENAEGALQALQQHLGDTAKPKATGEGEVYKPAGATDVLKRLTPLGMAEQAVAVARDPKGELTRATDFLRSGFDGVTLGFGDKALAGVESLAGGDYEDSLAKQRSATEDAKSRLGKFDAAASEVLGSSLPATRLAKLGITASNLPKIGKAGMMLDGSIFGGLNAAGHDENVAAGAATGLAAGAAGQGATALGSKAVQSIATALMTKPKVPSLRDLEAIKDAKYKAIDNVEEAFTPEQMQNLATGIGDDLAASGIDPVLNPMPYRFGEVIASKAQTPTTLRELDKIDSKIGRKLLTSSDGEDRYLGGVMRDNISEFLNANGGSAIRNEAIAANKRFRNLERVLTATDKAERRAASSGSGGNEDNAIRQNIRAILDNPKTARFYGPEEQAAMEKVVAGTTGQNVARRIGKMSPENGGLMAMLTTAGSMINPAIGIPAVGGFISKRIADRATSKNLDELVHLLSTGQPKPKAAPPISGDQKELIARLLMGGAIATSPAY